MHFIFSTGSLYNYSVERCFFFAKQAGFDGIELMVDFRWDTRQPDYLQGLIAQYDLPIRAVHVPFSRSFSGFAKDEPDAIVKSVKLAEAVGAQAVIHHLPSRLGYSFVSTSKGHMVLPNPLERGHRQLTDWLQNGMYTDLQAGTDVNVCIENLPATKYLGRTVNIARWNATNRQNISDITRFSSITMDTTHLGTWGLDPVEVFTRWGSRVKHVHLSNFDGQEHRRPEDGSLQLDLLLSRMAEMGYSHSVSLEVLPDALEAGASDERVIELLSYSLEYCRQAAE